MKYVLSARASRTTVYTSAREPIAVEPGGILDTNDVNLIDRLKNDPLFAEWRAEPNHSTVIEPEPPIEKFVTHPQKNRGGRPKKVKTNDADGTQAAGS